MNIYKALYYTVLTPMRDYISDAVRFPHPINPYAVPPRNNASTPNEPSPLELATNYTPFQDQSTNFRQTRQDFAKHTTNSLQERPTDVLRALRTLFDLSKNVPSNGTILSWMIDNNAKSLHLLRNNQPSQSSYPTKLWIDDYVNTLHKLFRQR